MRPAAPQKPTPRTQKASWRDHMAPPMLTPSQTSDRSDGMPKPGNGWRSASPNKSRQQTTAKCSTKSMNEWWLYFVPTGTPARAARRMASLLSSAVPPLAQTCIASRTRTVRPSRRASAETPDAALLSGPCFWTSGCQPAAVRRFHKRRTVLRPMPRRREAHQSASRFVGSGNPKWPRRLRQTAAGTRRKLV